MFWGLLGRDRHGSLLVNGVEILLGASFSTCLLAACGSASSHGKGTPSDGGHADSASASDAARPCNLFGTPSICARGQTCCLSDLKSTCRELRACTSAVQFECLSPDRCNAGEVCCATFIPLPRSPDSVPASALDGSAPSPDNMEVTAKSFCASSCAAPSISLCRTSADCANGAACTLLPEGANPGIISIAVEVILACEPPDGGAPP